MTGGKVRISLTVDAALYLEVRAFAEKDSRSVQSLLLHAVKAHLSRRRQQAKDEPEASGGSFPVEDAEGTGPVQARGSEGIPEGGPG
jgi:hypothetical protein